MVLLDRSEKFEVFLDHIYFEFKLPFHALNFLKMASVRVRSSPGFISRAGFSTEKITSAWF
jgi:hypothetical protein